VEPITANDEPLKNRLTVDPGWQTNSQHRTSSSRWKEDDAATRRISMISPRIPASEADRLDSLRALALLDTLPEDRFDRITRLAARIFDVPIALVSLVDSDRQWFKSKFGLEGDGSPREHSFCGHAILDTDVLHVPDATKDERFHDNPHVTGHPNVRFYAGCPIAAPDGALVGTVCVIDDQPREFDRRDREALEDLAAIVEQELAMQRLALDDDLTGLKNRRGFDLFGAQILALCGRQHSPAVVLFADVDGLKAANDTFGHQAGDQLLRDIARTLRTSLRDADVVARTGGDEFAAVIAGTDDATVVVDRLQRAIQERNRRTPDQVPMSISIGCARFDPDEPESLEVLVKQADAAMYVVKRASRAGTVRHAAPVVHS
jgi:diguanylate cyclase (GGDEF)-like protein